MEKKEIIEFLESLVRNPEEFRASIPEERFKELEIEVSKILKKAYTEKHTIDWVLEELRKLAKNDDEYANCLLVYMILDGATQIWVHAKLMGYNL